MQKAVINTSTSEVENIIEYADRGVAIRLPLGYVVYDCTNVPVQPGDTFADGKFYRNGVEVEYLPTEAEQLAALQAQLNALMGVEE